MRFESSHRTGMAFQLQEAVDIIKMGSLEPLEPWLLVLILTFNLPITTSVVCSFYLLMFLGSLYCKQYRPRSDCPQEQPDQVHIVCFHEKSSLNCEERKIRTKK